jgi:AcrR family transcriptional regulator
VPCSLRWMRLRRTEIMLTKPLRRRAARPSRRGTARALLTKALDTLIRQEHPEATVTVTELGQRAGVSRNSLYRYHSPILEVLREHQRHGPKSVQAKARKSVVRRRAENIGLRADIAKLAALVDHYYAAYRETASLLERRGRELAELRGKLHLKPAFLTAAVRS